MLTVGHIKTMKTRILLVGTALTLLSTVNYQLFASPLGAAFTYQGRLQWQPPPGLYDLRFALYDSASGGSQVGQTLTNSTVGVTNGLFTVARTSG